ncbi:MAG: HNH endonuclease, partial [Terriglobia bacterium]
LIEMPFSPSDKEDALVRCGRRCCICHKFCGTNIECAHIEAGAGDTLENCIPLCLDCHATAFHYTDEHPKGNKFNPSELRRHRDAWYEKVANPVLLPPDSQYLEADKRLFRKLWAQFPMWRLRDIVHQIDSKQSAWNSQCRFYWRLADFLGREENRFWTGELDAAGADLLESLRTFSGYVAHHFYIVSMEDDDTVYRFEPERRQDPEQASAVRLAEELLGAAHDKLQERIEQFIRTARLLVPDVFPLPGPESEIAAETE